MNELHLNIISPEKELFNGEVESVTLPGTMGAFTILPRHAPIISSLKSGVLSYVIKGGKEQQQTVNGGFVEMSGNEVSVCVD